jgi:hypothetical protein
METPGNAAQPVGILHVADSDAIARLLDGRIALDLTNAFFASGWPEPGGAELQNGMDADDARRSGGDADASRVGRDIEIGLAGNGESAVELAVGFGEGRSE